MLYIAMINDIEFHDKICFVLTRSEKDSNNPKKLAKFEKQMGEFQENLPKYLIDVYRTIYENDSKFMKNIGNWAKVPVFFIDSEEEGDK